jgi:hypothetical protein
MDSSVKQLFFSEQNYTGNDQEIYNISIENVMGTIPNYNDILYSSNIVTYDIDKHIFNVKGKIIANQIRNNSDINLKKDIECIYNALSIIKQLNGKMYKFKNSVDIQYGFIAQEVEKVIPNIVHKEDDGMLNMSYIDLIPFIIESIKELDDKINILMRKFD